MTCISFFIQQVNQRIVRTIFWRSKSIDIHFPALSTRLSMVAFSSRNSFKQICDNPNLRVTRLFNSICPTKFKPCDRLPKYRSGLHCIHSYSLSITHNKTTTKFKTLYGRLKKRKQNTTNINESNKQFKCDNLQRC